MMNLFRQKFEIAYLFTVWSPQIRPGAFEWLKFEFGTSMNVTKVVFQGSPRFRRPKNVLVQGSFTGQGWFNITVIKWFIISK